MFDFIKKKEQEQKQLEQAGAENITSYFLVNNSGYKFEKNGKRYDLRHWLNAYGCDVDYYTISTDDGTKTADTYEQAIQIIKTL